MLVDQLRALPEPELKRHMQALADAGYTVVERFMHEDLVAHLKNRIEDLRNTAVPRLEHPADDFGSLVKNTKQDFLVWNLQNADKLFIDLVSCPQLTAMLMPILNDPFFTTIPKDEPNYILSFCNARSSVVELPLHTDVFLPVEGSRTWGVQTIFALDDQTAENGCMVSIPGSHLLGRYVDAPFDAAQPVETRAGDLVIFSSRLWHGARANSSDRTRWAILGSFRMWWVKQLTDIPRGLPDAIYQQLTDSQKALLGYCSIPPLNERERISTKTGYRSLRPHVHDYYPPSS
jgi:ectoine hydroxylase-related dioxygenase (phytanoyl-CoA dioxygenase family)